MHLTLLKADGHFIAWVDGESVQVGMTLTELFGRLSRTLEDAVRMDKPISGSWETEFDEKTYVPPLPEDVARARTQLSCFKGKLIKSATIAEAPK
jgi:hypothetical protein